jgi:hypothetical protein
MALIIENGSLVENATSFVTVDAARAFAEARAATLPAADGDVETLLIQAMDLLEGLRDSFKGSKVDPATQALQWPRQDVVIDGWEVPTDHIPKELIAAQCQLAIEANLTDLAPTGDGRDVIREKVDVLETEYAPGSGGVAQPYFPKVQALLAPLLKSAGGLRVGRI